MLVADFSGPSAEFSRRKLLRHKIERANKAGLTPKAAFDYEFLVPDETAQSLRSERRCVRWRDQPARVGYGRTDPGSWRWHSVATLIMWVSLVLIVAAVLVLRNRDGKT